MNIRKGNIVLSCDEISKITYRIAKEIEEAVREDKKIPLLVGVMKGALNFMFDILHYISIPVYTDYIQISSYEGSTRTNNIKLLKDLSFDCKDRSVIIIEDIVDTGYSMKYLLDHIKTHDPKKIYVCALFDKKNAREVKVPIDFVGKVLEKNDFLIGYGLDYNELDRNLPFVYSATSEDVDNLNKRLTEDKSV